MIQIKIKPLSINKAFSGRRFKTQECKEYERTLYYILPKEKMIKGDVTIKYRFFLKYDKVTDTSNLIKLLEDILVKKGYIEDDRFVRRFTAEKFHNEKEIVEIEIIPYKYAKNPVRPQEV
jgi:Holliday junction resolvase RusA-like endonuclease